MRTRHLGVTNENSKGSRTKVKEGHHDLSERKNICVRKGNTEVSQGRKRAGRVKLKKGEGDKKKAERCHRPGN